MNDFDFIFKNVERDEYEEINQKEWLDAYPEQFNDFHQKCGKNHCTLVDVDAMLERETDENIKKMLGDWLYLMHSGIRSYERKKVIKNLCKLMACAESTASDYLKISNKNGMLYLFIKNGLIALCGNERDRSYNDYTLTSKRFDYMLSRFDFANWTEFKTKTNSNFEV